MKKRNTTIFAFLLLAAVGMGVGYAALTDNLTLGGSAKAGATVANTEWDANIYFKSAKIKSQSEGSVATMNATGVNTDALTLPVENMTLKGEQVVIEVTIINTNTDYDADLVTVKAFNYTTSVAGDFTITCDFNENKNIEKNNGEYTFSVTITLNVQPTQDLSATFGLEFNAVTIDEKHA